MIDLVFLTRPIIIVPVWAFCAFGMTHGVLGMYYPSLHEYLLIFLYSLAPASVYIINQMADYEVDKANEGCPLLVRCNIPMKTAGIFAAVCALTSILGPIFMGHRVFAILALIAIIVGYVYSCKPFSLSGRPFFDFLTNAFEALLAFIAGIYINLEGLYSITSRFDHIVLLFQPGAEYVYLYALPYLLLMCAGSISSTLPDIRGDRAHGKITTAVRFGPRAAHCIALGFVLAVIPVSLFIESLSMGFDNFDTALAAFILLWKRTVDNPAMICALLVIPAYIPYLLNSKKSIYMELPHKAGGAAVMLVAAATTSYLLLHAGIAVYFMTWLYFRLRHKVSYPSLKSGGTDV